MTNKRIKYFESDWILKEFYKALLSNDEKKIKRVHIPRSDVFYVREKIFQDTGIKYTLDRVERAMYLEGMLDAKDVLDPKRKRKYG
jgi:hypothetical protein